MLRKSNRMRKTRPCYILLYWLVIRNFHIGLLSSETSRVKQIPKIIQPTNFGFTAQMRTFHSNMCEQKSLRNLQWYRDRYRVKSEWWNLEKTSRRDNTWDAPRSIGAKKVTVEVIPPTHVMSSWLVKFVSEILLIKLDGFCNHFCWGSRFAARLGFNDLNWWNCLEFWSIRNFTKRSWSLWNE